jgi:MFS transporter, DHA1 family, inner membrane transport protein
MPFAIFALAAVNIAIGTQTFVFAGLLNELAGDLGVSLGTAGLLVPAASMTFAFTAPFATALVSRFERKRVMLIGLLVLALCNALCAVAPSFGWLFALRILGGIVTAFAGSLASVAVMSLVPPERRGRAFAIVVGGLTVALVLGVPLGSVVGGYFGWRTTFNYSALVCAASALLILLGVPRINPMPGPRAALAPLLRNSAIVRVFGLTMVGFAAAFTIVAYLGPIINHLTGLRGAGVGPLQAFIGVGSFIGLAAGGIAADRRMIKLGLMLTFVLMALDIAAYSWALSMPATSVMQPVVGGLILVLASAMFAAVPMNLAQLSQLAGPAAPVALALNGSLVSLGQGMGAVWGGIINDFAGLVWLGAGGAALAICGFALASRITADAVAVEKT